MNERGFAVVAALDPYHLLVCTLVTILMQGLFFVLAAALRFDLVTDLAGGEARLAPERRCGAVWRVAVACTVPIDHTRQCGAALGMDDSSERDPCAFTRRACCTQFSSARPSARCRTLCADQKLVQGPISSCSLSSRCRWAPLTTCARY